ncbi:hypothetical protein [Pseudohongiella spirulinae]|uniref:Uncharacterized protein n=1 Tax=Pseudohongiella spirulinae TaxID=1249552 RepID=A0A0S2KE52_9GAMM|nr:hypothetical protein [Pseudohongiella spirulinae]ALO46593.1 hypothetical protein PS2015_1950 [Pseudohongiella spirulinae]
MEPSIIGMFWYKPENYSAFLDIFEDALKLPASYDLWLIKAYQACELPDLKGRHIHRVETEPDLFLAWCYRNHMNVDSSARTAYSNMVAAQVARGEIPLLPVIDSASKNH